MFGRAFGRSFGLYFGVYDWWAGGGGPATDYEMAAGTGAFYVTGNQVRLIWSGDSPLRIMTVDGIRKIQLMDP